MMILQHRIGVIMTGRPSMCLHSLKWTRFRGGVYFTRQRHGFKSTIPRFVSTPSKTIPTAMSSQAENVVIDGSTLEGGGQILRNSISLSTLLGKPISINKIRNGRTPPGLKNQHRTGLELAAEICSGRLIGATNGSVEIDFEPGQIALSKEYKADTVTAGSITLLLQVALPILLFSPFPVPPTTLTLLGGTNASQAPQIDYAQRVFLPFMQRHFGLSGVDLEIVKRGYFPKGGGEVRVGVTPFYTNSPDTQDQPKRLHGIQLTERGRILSISGIAHFAGLPNSVGKDMVKGARSRLEEQLEILQPEAEVEIDIRWDRQPNDKTKGAGSGIVLRAELEGGGIIGGSAVGEKRRKPVDVGEEAANELLRGLEDDGCVDEWLQDQVIIFMALAHGKSELRCGKRELEMHTRTAIWVAEQLTLAKFEVEEDASGHHIIRCEGIGFEANSEHVTTTADPQT